MTKEINQCDREYRGLMQLIDVGVDISFRPRNGNENWAIVCINGKINRVQFVQLPPNDGRHLVDFLKAFERSNSTYDMPPTIKESLGNW